MKILRHVSSIKGILTDDGGVIPAETFQQGYQSFDLIVVGGYNSEKERIPPSVGQEGTRRVEGEKGNAVQGKEFTDVKGHFVSSSAHHQ